MIDFSTNPYVLAPMAGVTDKAMRLICRRYGCGLEVTEMVSAKALHYKNKKSFELFDLTDEEAPISVQLFGSEPEIMAEGAQLAVAAGAKMLDVNMGCPVPKVANHGEGSGLLRTPETAFAIIRAMRDAVDVPLSAKMRIGWEERDPAIVDFARGLEAAGCDFIAVHGRTRAQIYRGEADWTLIGRVKNNPAIRIPIIGNGDVDSGPKAREMFDRYGVDGVMIGRATYGRPWIFREVRHYLTTGEVLPQPTVVERVEIAKRHLRKSVEIKGEYVGVLEMRRHLSNYFKGLPDFKQTRLQLVTLTDIPALMATLDSIAERWGDFDTSQVVPAPLSHEL